MGSCLARKVAGTNVGPKLRRFDCVQRTEWAEQLSSPGPQGGCLASPLLYHEQSMNLTHVLETLVASKLVHESESVPCPLIAGAPGPNSEQCLDAVLEAQADLDCMRLNLVRGKHRRAVPAWSVPLEVWQLALCRKSRTCGSWRQTPVLDTNHIDKLMFQLLCCIRQSAASVQQWSASQTIQLDKRNGKKGCSSLRFIHLLDPIGKSFFKVFGINAPQQLEILLTASLLESAGRRPLHSSEL